jgi:LacI family transcriptional regulator
LALRIKDIAKLANVSTGTIDRVIHNRGEVSENTRKKVKAIVKELNYQPDMLASALASKKNYFFSVLMPVSDNGNSFWASPGVGMDKALGEITPFGVEVKKFLFDQYDRESFAAKAFDLLSDNPDGVLFAPVFLDDSIKFIKECNNKGIPVTLFNSIIENSQISSYIGQDSSKSGYLGGKLIHYGINEPADILLINLAARKDNYNHIIRREKSFRRYFEEHPGNNICIHTIDTNHASDKRIKSEFLNAVSKYNVKGIFVTNSRVYKIAECIFTENLKNIRLVGYDLLPQNVDYLNKGIIDFLISQRPEDQGYRGIQTLFNLVVLKKKVEEKQFIPIDIITRENIDYYK